MSTAGATVSNMNDAPLHSEFPFRANVSSLQARRDMRPSASSQISLVWEKDIGSNEIVGNSPALQRGPELVKRVAPYDFTWLLLGETGTGTELVAQAIQQRSSDLRGQIEAAFREARGKVYGLYGAASRLGLPATTLDSQFRALSIEPASIQMISISTSTRVVVPRDLVKSREFFVPFAQKFKWLFAGTSVALHGSGGITTS